MKKSIVFILMLLVLVGCGKEEQKNELYLFNWSDYIPNEVITDFETETGIKVITDYYSSNEEMYAKIKAGGNGYDITVPSTDYAEIMMKQGMLEKIDKSKIPNLKELNEEIGSKISFDKNHDYIIPYSVGATGIAVNTKYVKDFERSFDIYNRKDLKGKMTLLDDMREVMSSALIIAGHSPESSDPQDLADAQKIILGWKENILRFDSESFGKGFTNGEYLVVHGYYENIVAHMTDEQAENMVFFIPEKGAQMYIDSMTILKGAKNIENAYKFINYIYRPEVYVKIVDYLETPSINIGANKLRETKPVYDVEDLKDAYLMKDLGEALAPQSEVWNEILTQ
ncbi:MAG: extracellular solute-binding protein [Psychrilyobacter sp.]|uniref:extracellular solute-binding protein n=1 Tax=Psychrilyobacter sp. TaxID=2586924 RepID=UPI003C77FC40